MLGSKLRFISGIFICLVVFAVVAQSIIATIAQANQNSLQRYCVVATGPKLDVVTNGVLIGGISCRYNERTIEWDLQYKDFTGIPVALHIHGPIPYGLKFGPLAVALCGTPSTLACDTSVAGHLKGSIIETSAGLSIKPIIQAIRKEPWRYYLQTNTGAFPLGEVMGELNSLCGTPI